MFGHTRGGWKGGSVSKHWFFWFFWLFSMVFWFFLVFIGFLQYCLQVHSTCAECTAIWHCPTSKVPNVLRFGNAIFQKCRMYCDLAMQLSKSAECTAFWQCRCPKVPSVLRFGNAIFQKCRMYCVLAMQLSTSAECTAFWPYMRELEGLYAPI